MIIGIFQRHWWLAASFALVAGCAQDSQHGTVTGTVTLDGELLKTGVISFVPADGLTASVDATIAEGKFSVKVPVGEKKVTISSPKVVGKRKMYDTPDSPTVDITEELLPAQYNRQSTLTLTVKPGDQQAPFDLKSK